MSNATLFWQKIRRTNRSQCWEWIGYRKPDGYGRVCWGGRNRQAHSVAYELTKGPIPKGHGVLHTYDNPPCCNPSHLFVGTQQDNVRDMINKGRGKKARGESSGKSKLNNKKVRAIKKLLSKGMYQYLIGEKFGVSQSAIASINRGATWRHV